MLYLQHHVDPAIGVYIIDRYTYYALNFLEKVEPSSTKTLGEFVSILQRSYLLHIRNIQIVFTVLILPIMLTFFQLKVCPKDYCLSTVGVRKDLFRRDPDKVPVTDFFGSLRPVELTTNIINVLPVKSNRTKSEKEPERKYSYVAQFPDISQYT